MQLGFIILQIILSLQLVAFNTVASVELISKDLVNKKVERNIDLASQLVKIHTKITLENAGKNPLKTCLIAVEPSARKTLSYIGATKTGSDDEHKGSLAIRPIQVKEHKNIAFWEVTLPQTLEAGRTTVIEVETVFAHQLSPHPSHVYQGEKQLILYQGNLHFYSPYATTTQTTNVVLASANIESFTKTKPYTNSDTTINYGPFETTPALSQAELSVHYENNSPFLTVTNLERTIEVSHWGNIAIEELVNIAHTGAVLKGSFSRYEYQREQSGASSVKSFKTVLPAAASDVYYRDEIGNISTSHLRILEDAVEVDLRPRFPLFGGWKTQYLLGYNLPSYEYLFNNGDDYSLKIRYVDHIFDDMVVDHATVRFILPEGARDIHLKAPYEVDRAPDERHYTYLDTTGRTVVVVNKKNLVENHIQEVEIFYKYQKLLMLQEPLLVVLAFYLLFLLVIIYVRLDFSISKDEHSESKLRAASLCEKVQHHQDKIKSLYQQLDTAINNVKSNKDVPSFQDTNKKVALEHKNEIQAIQDLYLKLKAESAEATEKVNEINKQNRLLKDLYGQQASSTDRLVTNKLKKEQYIEQQSQFNRKKEEILEKIDNILITL